jgi:hypothetical protein
MLFFSTFWLIVVEGGLQGHYRGSNSNTRRMHVSGLAISTKSRAAAIKRKPRASGAKGINYEEQVP